MKYKDFSINDVLSFITAYETHSLSKCGEILYVSRQSIARSISKIESAAGTELFTRSEKGIFPNEYATAVYQSAKKIIESADEIIQYGKEASALKRPVFGVIGHYKTGLVIEEMLSAYASNHSAFQFEIVHSKWPDIIDQVLAGSVDFAYVANGTFEDNKHLDFIPIRDAQIVTLVHKINNSGNVNSIPAGDFFKQTVFLLSFFSIEQKIIDDYLQRYGIPGQTPIATSDFWYVDSILKTGRQSVLVMSGIADQLTALNPEYDIIPLEPPVIRHSGFICKKGNSLIKELEPVLNYLRSDEHNKLP